MSIIRMELLNHICFVRFHFVTYNVGTGSPEQDLHKLLQVSKNSKDDENKFDFYVIG